MLVGVIDPSHTAAKKRKPGVLPPWVTLEEAMRRAYTDPKWAPWTYELLNAITGEFQERGDAITASALVTHCPRAEVIKRKAEWVADLKDLYIPWKGTMIHRTMENYAHPEAIAEHRFFSELMGVPVSCSPDLLTKTTLFDYKYTDNPPQYAYAWSNHVEQVQLNAYICRTATAWEFDSHKDIDFTGLPFDPREHPVESVALVYLGPKWPKLIVHESKTGEVGFNPATGKFTKGKQPIVWTDEHVQNEFGPRALMFRRALESYPEFPDGAERLWGGDKTWECPGEPLCNLPGCIARRKVLKW